MKSPLVAVIVGTLGLAFLLFVVFPIALVTAPAWFPGAEEALRERTHDIPIFPGAEILKEGQGGEVGQEYTVHYKADPSTTANEVLSFYRAELENQGWEVWRGTEGYDLGIRRAGSRVSVRASTCQSASSPNSEIRAPGDMKCTDRADAPTDYRLIRVTFDAL